MLLGREQILKAEDLNWEEIDVPEWGGTVRVRLMTGSERDAFEQDLFVTNDASDTVKNMKNLRAKLVARCVCDENNKRVFADKDIVLLGEKSSAALDRVFTVCQRLNKIGPKDVEDLAKNSAGGGAGDSTSLSPVS